MVQSSLSCRHRARSTPACFVEVLFVASVLTVTPSSSASTGTSAWLLRASALERFLQYDMPLDKVPMIATHNSYNTESTSIRWEVTPNQVYGITDQLTCLGVRGLELDAHFIEELIVDDESEESAMRVCHTRAENAEKVVAACDALRWYPCEALDVYDYGDDTGCSAHATTLASIFRELVDWRALPENTQELVFIKMELFVDSKVYLVTNLIEEIFGMDIVFTPEDLNTWMDASGTASWPSIGDIVERGKHLVFAADQSGDELIFHIHRSNDQDGLYAEDTTSRKNFVEQGCPDDGSEPSWSRVQGDASTWMMNYQGLVLFEEGASVDEFLGEDDVQDVLECGLIPTFDRMDKILLAATVWSWQVGHPYSYLSGPHAAVSHSSDSGRWTAETVTESDSEAEIYSYACRNDTDVGERGEWSVSASAAGYFGDGSTICERAGLTFGAPRSAKENAALLVAMREVNVTSVWVNYLSPGGNASSTWSREGGISYTLPDTYSVATCDVDLTSSVDLGSWQITDGWVSADAAFFEKAYRIRAEVQEMQDKAQLLIETAAQEMLLSEEDDDRSDIAQLYLDQAKILDQEASRLDDLAREEGAYPATW